MSDITHVVAISGGKDSTAMALRLRELHPERSFEFLCTPTGDELPEMVAHWARLEELLGKPLTRVTNGTLNGWIEHKGGLPNHRIRWCTQVLKITPCLAWLKAHQPAVLYVGLRADEEERRGLYSRDVETRFPLREWGWGLPEVQGYLRERGIRIPARTDCARCYGQRLGEWRELLRRYPDLYADAERQEAATGQTFRSPQRDSHPAALAELRPIFERQFALEGMQRSLFEEEIEPEQEACRVCRL